MQISTAKLQAGSYIVWIGMYAPLTQMRGAVEAGCGVVVDNRPLLLEFELLSRLRAAQHSRHAKPK